MKVESLLIHGGIDGDENTGAVMCQFIRLQLIAVCYGG